MASPVATVYPDTSGLVSQFRFHSNLKARQSTLRCTWFMIVQHCSLVQHDPYLL